MWEIIKQIIESNFANIADLYQYHKTFAQKMYDTKRFIYFNYCHRKKINSVLTTLSIIVEFLDIPLISEKIMLINIIKEYTSMMCNILDLVIESILTHLFQS